jgi:hypothetical protein
MLGPPKPRPLDEPITVSMEALVPGDNIYRHVEAKLDLSLVREWSRDREPCGPSGAARSVLSCLRVITNQPGDRGAGELNLGGP